MKQRRRTFLKLLAGAGMGAATSPLLPVISDARETKKLQDEHVGMLYDATKCIGCKACEVACKKANGMPTDFGPYGVSDAPRDLSSKTLNIIKLYQGDNERSFIKRQCMHCVDPSCVSGCPTSALQKQKNGVVTWSKTACTGCRYCQMNCPFNIPKFDWESNYSGIMKCELCYNTNLPKIGQPACTEICPTQAVIFGKVKDLLAEAKNRIKQFPDRYINHVYGEKEGGGTSVLILSKVAFEKLGLPNLPDESAASVSESIQHGVYKGFIAPVVLYGALFVAARKNRAKHKEE